MTNYYQTKINNQGKFWLMSYCNNHINLFLTIQTKTTSACLLLPCHIVHVRPLSQWIRWTMCEVGLVQNVHCWPKKPQSLNHNNHSDNHSRNSKDICLRPWLLPLKCALIASALALSDGQIFWRWQWYFFQSDAIQMFLDTFYHHIWNNYLGLTTIDDVFNVCFFLTIFGKYLWLFMIVQGSSWLWRFLVGFHVFQ